MSDIIKQFNVDISKDPEYRKIIKEHRKFFSLDYFEDNNWWRFYFPTVDYKDISKQLWQVFKKHLDNYSDKLVYNAGSSWEWEYVTFEDLIFNNSTPITSIFVTEKSTSPNYQMSNKDPIFNDTTDILEKISLFSYTEALYKHLKISYYHGMNMFHKTADGTGVLISFNNAVDKNRWLSYEPMDRKIVNIHNNSIFVFYSDKNNEPLPAELTRKPKYIEPKSTAPIDENEKKRKQIEKLKKQLAKLESEVS